MFNMRRGWRILILLLVLVLVAGVTFFERLWVRGWTHPLTVAIYPIASDAAGAAFVAQLKADDFHAIGAFLVSEARRWRRKAMPAPQIMLMAPIRVAPPLAQPHSALAAIQWSPAPALVRVPLHAVLGESRHGAVVCALSPG
jgi:hypothetical protein